MAILHFRSLTRGWVIVGYSAISNNREMAKLNVFIFARNSFETHHVCSNVTCCPLSLLWGTRYVCCWMVTLTSNSLIIKLNNLFLHSSHNVHWKRAWTYLILDPSYTDWMQIKYLMLLKSIVFSWTITLC